MPARIPHRCAVPTCPELVAKGTYCDQHRHTVERDDRARHGSARERGYTTRWDKYRRQYLKDHPLCVRCLQNNRVTAAWHIDHVRPRSLRPDLFWERANHQPLCTRCHYRKTDDEAHGLIYQCPASLAAPLVPPVVIFGPPGSGKSTLAREIATERDLVLDLDEIEAAIAGRPIYRTHDRDLRPAIEKRNHLLQSLRVRKQRAILIVGAPTAQERYFWVDLLKPGGVMLLTGGGHPDEEECKRRIENDDRRRDIACTFAAPIAGWFAAYRATAWLDDERRVGGV